MPRNRRRNQTEVAKRPRIPNYRNDELIAVCTEIFGGEHMSVKCENGESYLGLIRGKIKKRMWVRVGDLILIQPFVGMSQPKDGKLAKAHIIWRYTRTQKNWLAIHKYISEEFLNELQNI